MPSSSIGFCVASTMNGRGSGYITPPMLVWRSCIASSVALWVLALARLISSMSTKLAWIGPSRVSNSPFEGSYTWVPTMSLGSRSGVHWIRENEALTMPANVAAAVVFARPGTLSSSVCPSASNVTRRPVRTRDCPTSLESNAFDIRATSSVARAISSSVIGENADAGPC